MYLDGSIVGFDINDIANGDLFLLNAFINAGVQLELLRALHRLESNDDMRHRLSVAAQWVFRLDGRQFSDFTFVHLLDFLDSKACVG